MLTGATSLDLVLQELSSSLSEVEDLLQRFLEDRHNGGLLQQAIEGLQQLRGTLTLIELRGASVLLEEMIALATDIPEHDAEQHNDSLSALCDSLFELERFLEFTRNHSHELPELLLPATNKLRQLRGGVAPLSEDYFFTLDPQRLARKPWQGDEARVDDRSMARLRQMYQVGLLTLLRDDDARAAAPLMRRALQRWMDALPHTAANLCWVADAALEAAEQTPLTLTAERKRLFARIDRQIKPFLKQDAPGVDIDQALLQHLLFLTAVADASCDQATAVREAYSLPNPGFTEAELQEAFERLRGPGVEVMRSLADALREELTAIKDLLDLLARNAAGDIDQSQETLRNALYRLSKTFDMLQMPREAEGLDAAAEQVSQWSSENLPQGLDLVADAVLQAETTANTLDNNQSYSARDHDRGAVQEPVELKEARIVLYEESQAGLALAKRAVTAYLESGNDSMHLMNVPGSLETVRGGLVFLGMTRAAAVIHQASNYIQHTMLEQQKVPDAQQLDVLADALTGIEFYLESAERSSATAADVLAMAADGLAQLGYPLTEE
ncbi:MAG: ferrous iron transporter B [Pseudomonadaceae bacterium]|nr:MAG: ferrous iron transporter B [Pseudomonadaceae bacterium]